MEIKQKRDSNRTGFAFGEDELKYSIQDSSGTRTFSVPYTDISRDRQTLEERNQWLRNAGLIWIALGAVFTVATWFSKQEFVPSMWLLIGGGCYAVYRLRSTRYTILPSDHGNLFVIDDVDGTRVIAEIEQRRAAQFREQYHYSNTDEAPEQQRNRSKWLHKGGRADKGRVAAALAGHRERGAGS